jgi:glycosyltransferase involved in cell wall biosynthesis
MMHIGFIEDTHFHGGTQIWVAEAVRAFIKRNQDVSLLAPEGSWIVDQCRDSGAEITTYDWDEVIHEDQQNQELWTNALRDWDVAIYTVHPPRNGFHCSMFAARCIKRDGLETHLISKTGTIVPEYLREFYLPDETINSSVIAIADFTRKYLIDAYNIPSEKIVLVYQGTDIKRFQHTESFWKESQGLYPLPKDAGPILGSIGSLEQRKGHPILFEAVNELLNSSLPNIHLMMVGDGPDEAMLKEKVIALGLERNISFFPFTRKPNYVYERLDMTVLPSLYKEGLPNVLLESMAMGVPVVSSDIGGVSEIVLDGETGYLVEPGDASALADAIQKVWGNQDTYQVMRTKARKLIERQFDKVTQFERFISHFQALIATV